jgi:hypothetical protein
MDFIMLEDIELRLFKQAGYFFAHKICFSFTDVRGKVARSMPHFYRPVPADKDEKSNVMDEYYYELKLVYQSLSYFYQRMHYIFA